MGLPVEIYLIQTVHGLVYGMLIFGVASGLTLVSGMMGEAVRDSNFFGGINQ